MLLLWHSIGGGRIFHSPSSPLFSLLALLSRLIYWETLSALLSKLKNYGFDQLVSQRNWHHLLDEKLGFGGTWLPWRNVRSWLHDGRVGEVADRVSSGSFRGGHWRYLPIRNHDNRSSADWIRLCPGLSKNSENGNSCPKPHKARTASLTSGSVTSAGNGCRTGWLLAGAGLLPLLQSRVSMVYYVLLLLRCFSCSHTVLPKEHSLGVIFFSPHFPHVMLYFSSIPCLPVLSTPLSYMYVVYVWTGWWLISLVLVTSDNKGLLLKVTCTKKSWYYTQLTVS